MATLRLEFVRETDKARLYRSTAGVEQWVPRSVCTTTLKWPKKQPDDPEELAVHEITIEDWWLAKNPFEPPGQFSIQVMRIVAFLQNMWVKNPERVKAAFERHGEDYRLRFMEYALFAGCVTGRRLRTALGEELCDAIIWEEASRVVSDNARDYHPPDPAHIKAVMEKHRPELVICFSRPAKDVIRPLCSCWMIVAPHPAARQADVPRRLIELRETIHALKRGEFPDWLKPVTKDLTHD